MYHVETTKQLRPVIINFDVEGEKCGLFHEWVTMTGHYAGICNYKIYTWVCGIIELPSGKIVVIDIKDFKFANSKSKFDGFIWEDS